MDIKEFKLSKTLKSCHEIYANWADVRQKLRELVGEFLMRLEEMIPEKIPKPISIADEKEIKEIADCTDRIRKLVENR